MPLGKEGKNMDARIERLMEVFGDFADSTVKAWDDWDMREKKKAFETRQKMWDEMDAVKKFSEEYYKIANSYKFNRRRMEMSDERIHEKNVKAVRELILDLNDRIGEITGEVKDFDGLEVTAGNGGFAVINGIVRGENGVAKVESILAGGYNIQRLHVRTLVHRVA